MEYLPAIQADTREFLAAIKAEAEQFTESKVVISNDAEMQRLTTVLRDIKGRLKEAEAKRFDLTRPLDATMKAIREHFRPFETLLERAERAIKDGILAYQREQAEVLRKRQEEENRRAKELEEKKKLELAEKAEKALEEGKPMLAAAYIGSAEEVVVKPKNVATVARTGTAIRTLYKFRIVDAAAIPREYLSIDEVKIGRVVAAMKGDTKIPGVEVYTEESVAARAL